MVKRMVACGLMLLALGLVAPVRGQSARAASRVAPGYLGIDVRDVNDDEIATLKLKGARGAEIIRVDHDGPAGKMGLREHDVVVQMNGAAIDGQEQIRRLLREIGPGRTVVFLVSRNGQEMTLTAQLADKTELERQAWEQHLTAPPPQPTDPSVSASPSAAAAPASKFSKGILGTILMTPSYTGVMLERLGPQLADFFGVPKGTGLLVKSVDNNSPAAAAGMKAGDIVVRADSKGVSTMADWAKVVQKAKGQAVTVVIVRDRQEKTLSMTPDAKKHG